MNFDMSFLRLFELSCFPVFVTDTNGKVLFKNSSAAKYMRPVRKSSNLFSHMTNEDGINAVRKGKIGLALFPEDFLYNRALIFTLGDKEYQCYLFAFLTKFQMNDYETAYSYLSERYSSDFTSILKFVKQEEYKTGKADIPSRLYSEIAERICFEMKDFIAICYCDMADFLMNIKLRCSRAFSALGYRMDYSATKEFLENRYISLDLNDFSFSFFMALYAVMRSTSDRFLSISAEYDSFYSAIRITLSTAVSGMSDKMYDESELVPECAAEINLCKQLPCYSECFSFSVKDGILSATALLNTRGLKNSAAVHSIGDKPSYRGAYAMLSFVKKMLSDSTKKERNPEKDQNSDIPQAKG